MNLDTFYSTLAFHLAGMFLAPWDGHRSPGLGLCASLLSWAEGSQQGPPQALALDVAIWAQAAPELDYFELTRPDWVHPHQASAVLDVFWFRSYSIETSHL